MSKGNVDGAGFGGIIVLNPAWPNASLGSREKCFIEQVYQGVKCKPFWSSPKDRVLRYIRTYCTFKLFVTHTGIGLKETETKHTGIMNLN